MPRATLKIVTNVIRDGGDAFQGLIIVEYFGILANLIYSHFRDALTVCGGENFCRPMHQHFCSLALTLVTKQHLKKACKSLQCVNVILTIVIKVGKVLLALSGGEQRI